MKQLNKKQRELLAAIRNNRLVLVPIHDNKGSPSMIDAPFERVSRATLYALLRRGFVDEQEETDGYNTSRITASGLGYLNDHGA